MQLNFNATIGHRLAWGFGCLLVLMVMVAGLGGWSSHRAGAQVRQIVDVNNRRAAFARDLIDNINLMAAQVRSIVLLTDVDELKTEAATLERARAGYLEAEKALAAALSGGQSDERDLAGEIAKLGARGLSLVQQAATQGLSGANIDATATLTQELRPIEARWRAKVNELISLQTERNTALAASVSLQTQRATWWGATLAAIAVALGILVAWRIARGIQRPIERAVRVAERIAEGDLDNPVEPAGDDEIGRLLEAIRTMQQRLRGLVVDIRDAAVSIHTASAEVATGNIDLSQRTEQAAAKLQQTAGAMEQLTVNLHQGANAAGQANAFAKGSAGLAQRGGSVVAEVVTTMGKISGSSKKIADIIAVIDSIAFQTNILALNAAVEAAQAGDLGRGFAVVAGEVRSLAQRSAAAAREIKELIGVSITHVDAGTRLVADAGDTMTQIVGSVQQVSDIIGEVTVSSTQQSHQIHSVNDAISDLDRATQQNAALVEQGAAAAESLKDQAQRLTALVAAFNLGMDPLNDTDQPTSPRHRVERTDLASTH